MKVFVTGASGYIGSVVAAAAQARGHQVLGLARSDSVATRLRTLAIEPLLGDMRDGACLVVGARRADAVIHCAAIRGPEMAEADRGAVTALLGALAQSGKPFIYTGSAFVYGDTGNRVVDEDAPLSPTAIGPGARRSKANPRRRVGRPWRRAARPPRVRPWRKLHFTEIDRARPHRRRRLLCRYRRKPLVDCACRRSGRSLRPCPGASTRRKRLQCSGRSRRAVAKACAGNRTRRRRR